MRLIFKEYTAADPKNYIYPYSVYGQMEEGDSVDDILTRGFLASRIGPGRFYLARGLRIDLENFELSSENRRIQRKTEYLVLDSVHLPVQDFDYTIGKLAVTYYNQGVGAGGTKIFRPQTIKKLLTEGFFNKLLVYKDSDNDNTVGYCIALEGDNSLHYAYPFYDFEYKEKNAGMGMMLAAIVDAKNRGFGHVYLGTVYTKESLYKLQFAGLEYFDGQSWNGDMDELKEKIYE